MLPRRPRAWPSGPSRSAESTLNWAGVEMYTRPHPHCRHTVTTVGTVLAHCLCAGLVPERESGSRVTVIIVEEQEKDVEEEKRVEHRPEWLPPQLHPRAPRIWQQVKVPRVVTATLQRQQRSVRPGPECDDLVSCIMWPQSCSVSTRRDVAMLLSQSLLSESHLSESQDVRTVGAAAALQWRDGARRLYWTLGAVDNEWVATFPVVVNATNYAGAEVRNELVPFTVTVEWDEQAPSATDGTPVTRRVTAAVHDSGVDTGASVAVVVGGASVAASRTPFRLLGMRDRAMRSVVTVRRLSSTPPSHARPMYLRVHVKADHCGGSSNFSGSPLSVPIWGVPTLSSACVAATNRARDAVCRRVIDSVLGRKIPLRRCSSASPRHPRVGHGVDTFPPSRRSASAAPLPRRDGWGRTT